jgi:uncharacterized protein YqjF (DUF2071 family)
MVAMLNYSVDPELLSPMVPRGTELDLFEGKTYISLIGFRFARTRVRGLWIPFHSDFEEVNLRFYLKRKAADETRRGVAFVREIVPRYAIAKVAQLVYGEPYVALPMTHRIAGPTSEGGRIDVQYRWRIGGTWNTLGVECEGKPQHAAPGSLEQFFTEHYWGYTARRDGSTVEYQVTHDRWRLWPAKSARFTGDCTSLYGAGLAKCLNRSPDSAFLADGSPVMVYPGVRV